MLSQRYLSRTDRALLASWKCTSGHLLTNDSGGLKGEVVLQGRVLQGDAQLRLWWPAALSTHMEKDVKGDETSCLFF